MIVALHEGPKGFFKTDPPHTSDELLGLVRKAASLGFGAIEIGPLGDYGSIDGKRLRALLDELNMKRSVHAGGLFDASKFAATEEESGSLKREICCGISLCNQIGSSLLSVHPPFFEVGNVSSRELLNRVKARFLRIVDSAVELAGTCNVKVALESFCYRPFIFECLDDFVQFVSRFSPERLGVLLDAGHLYQAGISLSEAVNVFRDRLVDVHIHDARVGGDYRKSTHLPIGEGTVDFSILIGLLRAVRFQGWLTLEIRGSEKDIKKSKAFLDGLLAQKWRALG